MSSIFGIFNRNGESISAEDLHHMQNVTTQWPHDDSRLWYEGSVGLGHSILWNTPESKLESLPKVYNQDQSDLVITADVRLDNRDELVRKLDIIDRPLCTITDSELLIEAYRRWGDQSPKYLLGDFAYIIWDKKNQTLFCARDHMGIKPFYFILNDDQFIFANDIEPIIALPTISKEINDEAVAIYFTFLELTHPTLTFYKQIIKLKPATTLKVTINSTEFNSYWDPKDRAEIKLNSEEDYIVMLRNLLETAIESRTKSIFPVSSHLSGGLDSSAISVIASRKLHSENKQLHTFNWLHTPGEDENKEDVDFSASQKIADTQNIQHNYIDFDKNDLLEKYKNHDIALNDTVLFWYEHFLRKKAGEKQARTILSGWGGDEFASSPGITSLAGQFWGGHIFSAMKAIYQLTKRNPSKHFWLNYLKKLVYYIILPCLPYKLYCRATNTNCGQENYGKALNQKFRSYKESLKLNNKTISTIGLHAQQLDLYNNGHIATRVESWASGGIREGIEYRYPLLDKRLIEFSLGIPEKYFCQNGYFRYIFRKSLNSMLPNELCWRANTKYEPNRLKKLQELSLSTVLLWLKQDLITKTIPSEYINNKDLRSLFFQLVADKDLPLDTVLDSIKVSILIKNLGHTHATTANSNPSKTEKMEES